MDTSPNAYSVDAFCDAYGVRRNLAYDEMKAGRLEYRKVGRRTLIRRIDADSWLNNLPKGNTDENKESERAGLATDPAHSPNSVNQI